MLRHLCQTSLLCLSLLGLSACGGSDRDEPFNPAPTSSNNSSAPNAGVTISITRLLEGTDPFLPFGEHKQIVVMRSRDEFYRYWDAYSDEPFDNSIVDFEQGQVVLIDEGGDNPCNQSINFRSFVANDLSNNTALITFTYRDLDAPNSSRGSSYSNSDPYHSSSDAMSSSSASSQDTLNCTNNNPALNHKRSYRFYFVKTRKTLLFKENLTY